MENLFKMSRIFGVSMETFFSDEAETVEHKPKADKMASLRELYKIGFGPSSSHTMGPEKACRIFLKRYPDAKSYEVILYGSLAKTGMGHGTDRVIRKVFEKREVKIRFDYETEVSHVNTMDMIAYGERTARVRAISVGGGSIEMEGYAEPHSAVYPHTGFSQIKEFCENNNMELWDYVLNFEGDGIKEYLAEVWAVMKESIESGLDCTGELPGGLHVQRKAKYLLSQRHVDETGETRENRMVCAYAFAVSEENACANRVVTAPTCGASGVVPAVLYYQQIKRGFSDDEIIKALGVGGIVGNLIKTNASISGAECGCQAEIGSACAMAAAMLGTLFGLSIDQIEYASEIAIEHHLGLTCDPVCGLVQIPCIERNAVAAMRAINAVSLAGFLSDTRKISLDHVIQTMKETGHAISKEYRETSEGGLAKIALREGRLRERAKNP